METRGRVAKLQEADSCLEEEDDACMRKEISKTRLLDIRARRVGSEGRKKATKKGK